MTEAQQQRERDRLLTAQLLMAMRGLAVEFPVRLYTAFTRVHTEPCHFKNQDMMGFLGQFVCNALLPDDLGIGHAVSHGYGWLASSSLE